MYISTKYYKTRIEMGKTSITRHKRAEITQGHQYVFHSEKYIYILLYILDLYLRIFSCIPLTYTI